MGGSAIAEKGPHVLAAGARKDLRDSMEELGSTQLSIL